MPILTLHSHGHLLALLQPRHAACLHSAAEVAGGLEGEVAQKELVAFCHLPALLVGETQGWGSAPPTFHGRNGHHGAPQDSSTRALLTLASLHW